MRTRFILTSAALLLTAASLSDAQTVAKAPSAPAISGTTGTINLGGRFGSVKGDGARFERYRDLRNGAASELRVTRDTERVLFNFSAVNVGYLDQQYAAEFRQTGKAKLIFTWDSVPTNFGYNTSVAWREAAKGVWTMDNATRLAVQNRATSGVLGIPTTAVQSAQASQTSAYLGLLSPFDIQARRDIADLSGRFAINPNASINLAVLSTARTGYRPFGASFAFNNANELPLAIDDRTNNVEAAFEYVRSKGMFRVGWEGSWYNNDIKEFIWDNPLRQSDFSNGLLPPLGPFDPSAYSNGNGPARGRMSVSPSNSVNAIKGVALYKLPSRTTLNGALSVARFDQNDPLIPWTINPVIANPAVYAVFPELAHLPRPTAEAGVRNVNALINLTSRPNRLFGLTLRYRFNNHDNTTPVFHAEEYVRFDAVPEEGGGHTKQFDIRQNTLEATATFNVAPRMPLRFSYIFDDVDRKNRAFEELIDHVFRTSFDLLGNQFVTLRVQGDVSRRVGSGFNVEHIEESGAQPGTRYFDDAERDRNRGTLILIVDPSDLVTLNFSVAAGKDRYHGEGLEFGLLDNSNSSYNAGFAVNPNENVSLGVNYGYDRYRANQRSRNASPLNLTSSPPDLTWLDPERDWTLDNDEVVHNVGFYLDLLQAVEKTDVRVGWDFSDSDNAYNLGGPRVASLTLANAFLPLPDVTNRWQRFTADVQYMATKKVGVGAGYWYEKFNVANFSTIDTTPGVPANVVLGGLVTGYGSRPYEGNTAFVRLLFRF
jgi:MtrB/PioB family decaheme-associated outer membrane protein